MAVSAMTDRPTQRYKLIIAYRGTNYHGWQYQVALPNYRGKMPPPGQGLPTIQEVVERALKDVVRHPLHLCGSSRTDSGVHAKGQLAHFDTDQLQIPTEGMRRAVNHALPDDILIRSIEPVPSTFNAITSTTRKRYQYAVWNGEDRPLFFADLAWHRWKPLDIDAIREGAKYFVGEHDFESFSRPGHRREGTVRTIHACDVSYRSPKLVFGIEGNGFLWNMVRIMVGTLVEVGLGKFPPSAIREMIAAKDRRAAGSTAPPHGLYLHWIKTRDPLPSPGTPGEG